MKYEAFYETADDGQLTLLYFGKIILWGLKIFKYQSEYISPGKQVEGGRFRTENENLPSAFRRAVTKLARVRMLVYNHAGMLEGSERVCLAKRLGEKKTKNKKSKKKQKKPTVQNYYITHDRANRVILRDRPFLRGSAYFASRHRETRHSRIARVRFRPRSAFADGIHRAEEKNSMCVESRRGRLPKNLVNFFLLLVCFFFFLLLISRRAFLADEVHSIYSTYIRRRTRITQRASHGLVNTASFADNREEVVIVHFRMGRMVPLFARALTFTRAVRKWLSD